MKATSAIKQTLAIAAVAALTAWLAHRPTDGYTSLASPLQPSVSHAAPPPQTPPHRPRPEVERGPRQLRQVALTFDAGGEADALPQLLATLEKEQVKATFFLTGKWAAEYPACARAIAAHGHLIGNHTWSHKDLTKLTPAEVKQEILRADDMLVSWFDTHYRPFFRAPYGETNDTVLAAAEDLGFHTIRWSIDTLDAMEPRKPADFIEQRVTSHPDDDLGGAIVLMHVGYPETVAALPGIIRQLRNRGFELVTLSDWIEVGPRPERLPTDTPDNAWPVACLNDTD